jgi:hypothetical protein
MRQAIRKLSPAEPYDERTFRYLLGIEERRSNRSGRPFLLVLVDILTSRRERAQFDPDVATTIFSMLSRSLRETDFIGWYEHGARAGAVLTELGEGSHAESRQLLTDKVMARGLLEQLPADLKDRLHIQVSRYPMPDAP